MATGEPGISRRALDGLLTRMPGIAARLGWPARLRQRGQAL